MRATPGGMLGVADRGAAPICGSVESARHPAWRAPKMVCSKAFRAKTVVDPVLQMERNLAVLSQQWQIKSSGICLC